MDETQTRRSTTPRTCVGQQLSHRSGDAQLLVGVSSGQAFRSRQDEHGGTNNQA